MIKAKPNFLLILTFFILGIFFATTINTSGDTFWHLAVGRQVWQEKKIPKYDKFIYGPEDKTFNSVEWLSALVFYLTAKSFGLKALIALRVVIGLATLYFIYRTLSLVTQNDLVKALTLAVTGYVFAYRLYDRPEIFSFLFLAFVNYCCFYYYFKKKLSFTFYILPFIFLIWPNIHPFTIFGLVILAIFLTAIAIQKFILKAKIALFNTFAILALISFALSVIQYRKLFIFLEFNKFAPHEVAEFYSLLQKALVSQGFDFFNQLSFDIYIYLIVALVYFLAFLTLVFKRSSPKPYLFLSLAYLGFLFLPLKVYRLLPAVAIIIAPQFVWLLKSTWRLEDKINKLLWVIFASVIAILLTSIAGQRIAGIRDYQLVLYERNKSGQAHPVAVINNVASNFPDKTTALIRENLATKRIFASTHLDNYFIWQLPGVQVFADALFYNRADEDYRQESILAHGGDNFEDLLKKFDIDTVVNSQGDAFWPNSTPVWELAGWQLIYVNSISTLYARNDVIKSKPLDLSTIRPELTTPLKYKPEDEEKAVDQLKKLLTFDSLNGFARNQLILYYFDKKDYASARKLAEQSRSLMPKDAIFSLSLAAIYSQTGKCPEAQAFAREAVAKSFNYYDLKKEADTLVSQCHK